MWYVSTYKLDMSKMKLHLGYSSFVECLLAIIAKCCILLISWFKHAFNGFSSIDFLSIWAFALSKQFDAADESNS